MNDCKVSFLCLDYKKEQETLLCLHSIKQYALFPHKTIYLDNGSNEDYPFRFYKDGLCDVLISKHQGGGGGFGQTDLFRFCDTEYAIFVQTDQELLYALNQQSIDSFIHVLDMGFHCVDLNGDQSRRGVWTDRAHFIRTDFFNALGPFPNGGPGNDALPWNEAHLQKVFQEEKYQIYHLREPLFRDNGKWSIREAGDGVFRHRCDLKTLWVVKQPTFISDVYPPLNEEEKADVLAGRWPLWGKDEQGRIPEAWKAHSFQAWN